MHNYLLHSNPFSYLSLCLLKNDQNKQNFEYMDEIVWRGTPRRIAWSIISHMRLFLQVDVHPVISNSFMMIHNYYQSKPSETYKLYILILTSIFTTCKQNEISKSMPYILSCLLNVCREFSKKMSIEALKNIIGLDDFTNRQITNEEIVMVNNCELDLIEANEFQMMIDMPFSYTTEFVSPNIASLPSDTSKTIDDNLLRYLCVILCSEHCNDFHPEIMAVAASLYAFNGVEVEMPEQIKKWINDVIEKYGKQQIDNAKTLLQQQYAEIAQQK